MRALFSILFLAMFSSIYSCQLKVKKTEKIKVDSIKRPNPVKPVSKARIDSDKYADSAMTVVENLPEIKALSDRFNKENKHTSHHFALNVAQGPGKDFKYYWVRAGEDTHDHFAAYEHFYVDPKDFTIYYYDVVSGSVMTIDQWRKSGKDKWYKKKKPY
jgi:hypothetical protein